jgi:hypothetical protein
LTATVGITILGRKSTIDRRNFLKTMGGIASGIGFASLAADKINKQSATRGRVRNVLGPVLYNATDYRDVATSEALDILCRDKTVAGSIKIIAGDTHREAVLHYCQSPKERQIKLSGYLPLKNAGFTERSVTVLIFDDTGHWVKIKEYKF